VLAALVEAAEDGRGTLVDAALVDSQVGVLATRRSIIWSPATFPSARAIVPQHRTVSVFPVADGHIIIATGNDNQYRTLWRAWRPELAQKGRVPHNTGRLRTVTSGGALSTLTKRMKSVELLDRLEAVAFPLGPINDLDQVFADPQVIHRACGLSSQADGRQGRKIPGVRTPIMIAAKPVASPAPRAARRAHRRDPARDRRGVRHPAGSCPDAVQHERVECVEVIPRPARTLVVRR